MQYSSYWIWTAIWLLFGTMGRDPITIKNPIVVNNESGRLAQDEQDYGQAYHTIHYMLFMFVVVYQSLQIMLAQVTKRQYQPYNALMCFLYLSMITIMLLSFLRDGDVNFKMCITLLCGIVAVVLSQFIISVIGEMTAILGIELFTTKQVVEMRKQKQKLKDQLNNKSGGQSVYSVDSRVCSEEVDNKKKINNSKKGDGPKRRTGKSLNSE